MILVINPGSISLKIAIYKNEKEIFSDTILNKTFVNNKSGNIDQEVRIYSELIVDSIKKEKFKISDIEAVVGRGGLIRPVKGGIYRVNKKMINDLSKGVMGKHPSNYGGLIADRIGKVIKCNAYIIDPVVVDEMAPVAKISGMPRIERKSIFHALNQKAVARKVAKRIGKLYAESNIIIVHMGGGITAGCHKNGYVIDVNNGLDGEGPFSPERSGTVPAGDLVEVCFSGKYSSQQVKNMIKSRGGMLAYLGTNDLTIIEKRIKQGDKKARLIYQAMIYQICKEVGALSTVVNGMVDAIALTGGLAKSKEFVRLIKNKIKFIAPVYVYPGEFEMEAMASGALRILKGKEKAKKYN
jgi:butyrate kinase